jgi:hypothetical protein
MESTNNNVSDAFLDEAAAHAIGAQSADEAAAFEATLASASPAERQAAAHLREATARLAAASPYMEPPESLRGAILAATAPATFNIKDYRRTADDRPNRYRRWGVAAAAICLVWSGFYSMQLRQENQSLRQLANSNQQRVNAMAQQLDSERAALHQFIDPDVRQIILRGGADQKVVGKMLVDTRTNKFMVVMPDAVIPPNSTLKMAIEQNGRKMELTAVAVGGAPGSAFFQSTLPHAIDPAKPVGVQFNDQPRLSTFGQ